MTITIHIEAHPDRGDMRAQIDGAMAALGFEREAARTTATSTAALATAPAVAGEEPKPAETARKTTRTKKADAPQVSTNPENRVGPEDDAETQAQDAADEAAEVEAAREPEKPLTVDDVKAAVGLYVEKHGMSATQEDGPKVFVSALGKPPAGEDYWKMSLLANATQEQLQKAVKGWKDAAAAGARYAAKGA